MGSSTSDTRLSKVGHWYADQVMVLWSKSLQHGVRSFSLKVKRAQLLQPVILGTLLLVELVDEAQDMDECQVDWVTKQHTSHQAQLYVVGDAAQSIYYFQGRVKISHGLARHSQ
jgi:hypothetical protein